MFGRLALALLMSLAASGCEVDYTPGNEPDVGRVPAAADHPGRVFLLPTSDWSGGSAEEALLKGVLHREGTCLVAVSARNPTAVVWPAGFVATINGKRVVSVRNVGDSVVASSGRSISVGGGYTPTNLKPWKSMPCVGEYDSAFVIQDSMTALGQ